MDKARIIKYSKQAVKFIKKQEQSIKYRLRKAIDGLKSVPMIGDILPMEGYRDGRMRLRVGNYRIIFKEINERKDCFCNRCQQGHRIRNCQIPRQERLAGYHRRTRRTACRGGYKRTEIGRC